MPKLSIFNGLEVEDVPESLEITDVENQMIAKTILFMKLKLLPKSGIGAMVDRVVNVPLNDSDIVSNVNVFPRTLEQSAIVPIQFKRKKEFKANYLEALVRPQACREAVITLKRLGNKHYENVEVSEAMDIDSQNDDVVEHGFITPEDEIEERDSDEDMNANDPVKKFQCTSIEASVIAMNHPEAAVVVNTTNAPIAVKVLDNEEDKDKQFVVAPGEGMST